MRIFVSISALVIVAAVAAFAADEKPSAEAIAAQKKGLGEFNSLIGKWRGTGQPRRGSNQGAWREDAEWVWDFSDAGVAVRYDVTDGQLMKTGRVTYDPESKKYQLVLTAADESKRTYSGTMEEGKLTLVSEADASKEVHRLTVTRLNEKRTLALFEKRGESQTSFNRVAEVGYTREGTKLAKAGTSGPECIVTGGEGTIPVSYKGKTYYVCCTGCKQAFDEDPEKILKEAEERRKKEAE
jgi:YHS domain-containing protein